MPRSRSRSLRVDRALLHLLVGAESAALAQQLIDQRGLAMVDMGDDGDVAHIHRGRRYRKVSAIGGDCCGAK